LPFSSASPHYPDISREELAETVNTMEIAANDTEILALAPLMFLVSGRKILS